MILLDLHDEFLVPNNGIGMEVDGWVKPEVKLLLPITFSLAEHICVKGVRLASHVS